MDLQTIISFILTGLSLWYVARHLYRVLTRGELPAQCRNCALQQISINANNKNKRL